MLPPNKPDCCLILLSKSQVAIEYCYRFLDQSPKAHVFWINAGSVDRFEQGFKRIARKLELPGWNGYAVNPCELVKDWFQVEAAGEWLLVLDGIDDMDTVFPSHCSSMERSSGSIPKYIPRLGSGRLLLTSRDKRIGTRITSRDGTLKLNQPSLMESSSLLQRKIHDFTGEPLNFEVLVKELSCLPLAVTQAAAYMNESCIDTSTYIKLLREEESPAEILEEELGDVRRSYDDNICSSSVYRTFQISFERLRFQNDQAAELLALIGSLEGCAVPVSLLRGEDKASNPSHLTAVALLESLSLIEFQKGRQALSLHRLVHLCIRRWLQLNCTTVKWHNEAMLRVFKAFPRFSAFDWAEKGMDRWTACEILLPHALLLLRNTHLSDRRANLQKKLHVLVVKYKGQRSWREPLANEIQEIYYYFGANDLKWHLRTCDELVLLRREQGRYAEAVQVLEQALQTTGKQPVTNTAVALQARLELAFCLYGLGNFKKSTEVLNATREASRLSNDGEDSFRQCRCDEIQGMLTASSGSPVAALTLFENVVQWKVETLGEKHRTTLNSKRNLFMTLVKAGRFIDAETMGQDTVAAFTEVEGSAHPRTIWVKCVLAETFMFLDKFKAAERLSLDILQKPLEKSKTKTRYIALFVLMSSYWSQGRDEERNVIEEELCVFVNEKTRADKGDIDGLNLLLELGSYFHRRGKGATGKMLVEACLHAQEHASAEEIDLEESKLRLHEIVSCKCRGVDVTMGCWQPRCKYRGIGFQGIINPRVRSHKVSKKQESRP